MHIIHKLRVGGTINDAYGPNKASFTETMPTDENTSVSIYGGYYIGRFEAGIDNPVLGTTDNTSNSLVWTKYTSGTLVVQKEKQVWNYVTRDKSKELAESLYKSNSNVKSKLCSSYAWDTTLKFIETKNSGYITSGTGGNYSGSEAKTGKTTPVNNIYDMGGNMWEWTTELCINSGTPNTDRGGCYIPGSYVFGPYARGWEFNYSAGPRNGFRIALYIK